MRKVDELLRPWMKQCGLKQPATDDKRSPLYGPGDEQQDGLPMPSAELQYIVVLELYRNRHRRKGEKTPGGAASLRCKSPHEVKPGPHREGEK
jgi:hypothetical protein